MRSHGFLFPLFVAAIAAGTFLPAALAVAPIGDNGELFVTGVATASENSNLFLSHEDATSVGMLDLIPGLSYEFGKNNALVSGQLAYNEDFQFFSKSSKQLDYQLANIIFWMKYADSMNSFNIDASFHQADQAEVGIQNVDYLVKRNLYHADGTDEMGLTDKTSISGGVAVDDTEYRQSGYAEYYYAEVPLNVYYKVDPKLDLSAGFRYRTNSIGLGGVNSEDYFYNVGARGQFTENLTGQFNVGYQEASLDNGLKYNGLGADSKFTLTVDPKTSIDLTADDDFSYAATGDAIRTATVAIGATSALTDQWAVKAQLGCNDYSYITSARKDNFYSGQVGVTYIVNSHVNFTVNYTYGHDDSSVTVDNFNDSIFSLSGALRF